MVHTSKSLASSRGPETEKADFLSNPMLDAKCNRKRAEVDLQLLANRIALLKAEEAKALQKVTVTKDRASEILQIKKRNESSGTDRASVQMAREEQLRAACLRAQTAKATSRIRLAETKQLVNETKQAVAVQKRLELDRHLEETKRKLLVEEVEKRQRAEEQRRRHDLIKQRSLQETKIKEQKAQAQYSAKLAAEQRRTEEAESLIAQLEREEKDMLERLRCAHSTQQNAYQVLKRSLES